MTGTAVISPFYILGRDAFLLLVSLAGAEYEIENDAALVRERPDTISTPSAIPSSASLTPTCTIRTTARRSCRTP